MLPLPPEPYAVRLARARASVAGAEIVDLPANHPLADQANAASRDTLTMTTQLAGVMRNVSAVAAGEFRPDQQARVLAAIMRCDYCPHVEARGIVAGVPTIVVLPAGWIGCERCVAARCRGTAADPFPRNGTPGRETCCDYCDTDDGAGVFAPLILRSGALVVTGHACSSCILAFS